MRTITTVLSVSLLLTAGAALGQAPATGANNGSQTILRSGSQPASQGPAEFFTGSVRVEPLFPANDVARISGAYVTFQPGARSAWHTHPAGQHLIVTAGVGRTQVWGGPVEEIRAGDTVWCPPGLKHWHGASPTTAMTHIALTGTANGKNVDWLEKVTDEQYGARTAASQPAQGGTTVSKEPSAIQKQIGDFAPKLAQLTDDVLFGDIWERPELAPRDRSLITVAALTVGGNAEQLPFHLNKAKENGLTEQQIVEALTHLAFYTGWPRALSAINVAKQEFRKQP